jgi:hypothetical protein
MSTVKEEARRLIDELPEDVDWDELRIELRKRCFGVWRIWRPAAWSPEIERKYGFRA